MGDNKIMNPQRLLFKENYCNPGSETFGNAYQSAIKAGFEDSYAKVIASPGTGNEWVKEIIKTSEMLSLAEGVLKETLEMDCADDKYLKIKQDSAKFVAGRLGKGKWSERTEHTGKDGKDLPTPILGTNALSENLGTEKNSGAKEEN